MKKVIAGIAISAMALMSGATSAVAAPAPSTLVLSGGNGVYQLDPIVVNATASAAGTVALNSAARSLWAVKQLPQQQLHHLLLNVLGFLQLQELQLFLVHSHQQMQLVLHLQIHQLSM